MSREQGDDAQVQINNIFRSPFPPSKRTPGTGHVHLSLLASLDIAFKELDYTYPLKLVPSIGHPIELPSLCSRIHCPCLSSAQSCQTPLRAKVSACPLLFMLSYGGGLIAGDRIKLGLNLDPSTRLTLTTQGMTKIFRPASPRQDGTPNLTTKLPAQDNPTTQQTISAHIGPDASLWLAPDPCQPFEKSCYEQIQRFDVASSGSIGLVDWVIQGRQARGESWACSSWQGRNEIWKCRCDRIESTQDQEHKQPHVLLIRDTICLQNPGLAQTMRFQTPTDKPSSTLGIVGSLILHGPMFTALAGFLLDEFNALPRVGGRSWSPDPDATSTPDSVEDKTLPTDRTRQCETVWRSERCASYEDKGVLWTACRHRECVVVKFTACSAELARDWLGSMLRREGSIGREFGPGGLFMTGQG